ncbi:hypothetical protein ED733_004281 [Metarhizium rileyi]|uniref:Uncharacterized protein n=1 Tax=Metarhizium rileyi (strain RCEF 4871) TaxID=1649241 RepID=A0A5C6GEE6_METRR|nr:hypothetical protein ED733_004281 [Metarhizium rileyi]
MAPIPVYSSSPITAAKPTGVTPKTSTPGESNKDGKAQLGPSQTSGEQSYAAAQPGARPVVPKATGAPTLPDDHVLATPTRTSSIGNNPPPPQPGAVPVPPGGVQTQQPPAVTTMPPQMGYQPPQAPLPIQGRSSTVATAGLPPQSSPTGLSAPLQGNYPTAGVSPQAGGYQQDVNAAGYNSYQRTARAYEEESEASVWDTARKWATSAGESLVAAENEVWKRINKD